MMSISPLLPRTALVTGAGRRIGRAIALDLARQGFAVALHYSASEADVTALAAEIAAMGGQASIFQADLAHEAETAAMIGCVTDRMGALGLLVNNASTFERDEVADASRASWDLHVEVNLRAPFVLSQAFAAQLPADAHGVIINMLDQRVWNLTPHFVTYTVSKAGLWTLTQTLALALAPRIRVAGIGPGPALASARQTPAQFAAQCASTPLGIGTSPDEITAAVRFILASPSFTGQMLALDGGQHLQWGASAAGPEE